MLLTNLTWVFGEKLVRSSPMEGPLMTIPTRNLVNDLTTAGYPYDFDHIISSDKAAWRIETFRNVGTGLSKCFLCGATYSRLFAKLESSSRSKLYGAGVSHITACNTY
jgi:hypothetical protein